MITVKYHELKLRLMIMINIIKPIIHNYFIDDFSVLIKTVKASRIWTVFLVLKKKKGLERKKKLSGEFHGFLQCVVFAQLLSSCEHVITGGHI